MTLRLLALNIANPSPTRAQLQLAWLRERPEDVLVLSETKNSKGSAQLLVGLQEAGWAVVASALFAFYVGNFGSYNKTYGALAGVVVFLIWFWLINVALLFGIELDAEIERTRELTEGVPRAEKEIQLDAREDPKRKQTT